MCVESGKGEHSQCVCEGKEALTCVEASGRDEGIVCMEVTHRSVCQLLFAQNTFVSGPDHLLQRGIRFDVFAGGSRCCSYRDN